MTTTSPAGRDDDAASVDTISSWLLASEIMTTGESPELARWNRCRLVEHPDHVPDLLLTLWLEGLLSTAVLGAVLDDVWHSCAYPERVLDRDDWRQMFNAVGYRVDGCPNFRPRRPLQLYRVCFEQDRLGWTWISDRQEAKQVAAASAARWGRSSRLWTVTASPVTLLAATTTEAGTRFVVDLEADPELDLRGAVTEVSPFDTDAADADCSTAQGAMRELHFAER